MYSANLCLNQIVQFEAMAVLKFAHKHATSEVMGLIQNFLFLYFISQLLYWHQSVRTYSNNQIMVDTLILHISA